MSQTEASGVTTEREFVLMRTFDAPRERVFRAWTTAEGLARWFGPKGGVTTVARLDLRPGGVLLTSMALSNGVVMWGKWDFREVAPPERLVFVQSFSDEHGGLTRHPFAPDWPRHVLSTVEFAEHEGRTTLTLRGEPLDATEAEVAAFRAGFEGMTAGWGGTFAQLEAYLATA